MRYESGFDSLTAGFEVHAGSGLRLTSDDDEAVSWLCVVTGEVFMLGWHAGWCGDPWTGRFRSVR